MWPLIADGVCYTLATVFVSAEVRFVNLAIPVLAMLASNLDWPKRAAGSTRS